MRLLLFVCLALGACASQRPAPRAPRADRSRAIAEIQRLVSSAAMRYGVAEDLLLAVIKVESSFRPGARSPVGARGLMQLMPATAASLAAKLGRERYDIEDPEFNIEAGTYYLSYLIDRFGDTDVALAAYNAGPTRIDRLLKRGGPLPDYGRRYAAAVATARKRFSADGGSLTVAAESTHDQEGLRALLRERLYGERPDERLP